MNLAPEVDTAAGLLLNTPLCSFTFCTQSASPFYILLFFLLLSPVFRFIDAARRTGTFQLPPQHLIIFLFFWGEKSSLYHLDK